VLNKTGQFRKIMPIVLFLSSCYEKKMI